MGGIGSGRKSNPQTKARHEMWKAYKAQGHTMAETAKHFGVSKDTIRDVCKGIAPQIDTYEQRELHAIEIIRERAPLFNYAGGYSGIDSPCRIRCKVCGTETVRSFTTIRQGKARCAVCSEQERKEREEAEALEKERRLKDKEKARELREAEKIAERKRKAEERKARTHPCAICGKPTANKYCCSVVCSQKRNNQIKEVKRRIKLKEATIDEGITLQKLFFRDGGVCYLCGERCDWSDKEEKDGTIICGNTYPSIDHVIPLAKGGKHEWSNVKLAHRLCNSCKSDRFISPWV